VGMPALRIVVIGAGIAGLTAAYDLARTAPPGSEVLVLEGSRRVGGKLRVSEVAGVALDEGAEAALARVPDVLDLMAELGLAADVVHPATTTASIALDGALHPVPAGTLLGVPTDVGGLHGSGLFTAAGLAAVAADVARPGPTVSDDVSVGALIRDRLGAEVLDRLVEPLLGGVYAGRADLLSVQATMPVLAAALRTHGSVVEAARAARAAAPPSSGPVFASLPGGLGRLAGVLAATPGLTVRTSLPVRELARTGSGCRIPPC